MPRRHQGYAADTSVPVDRSKQAIEALLKKHGADGFQTGWQGPTKDDPGWDVIGFLWKNRQIRFRLVRPKAGYSNAMTEQKNRQRWRILYLVIKAKLEAVLAGVSVFEAEFLAHIVTADDQTVGEILVPRLTGQTGQLRLHAPRDPGPGEDNYVHGEVVK